MSIAKKVLAAGVALLIIACIGIWIFTALRASLGLTTISTVAHFDEAFDDPITFENGAISLAEIKVDTENAPKGWVKSDASSDILEIYMQEKSDGLQMVSVSSTDNRVIGIDISDVTNNGSDAKASLDRFKSMYNKLKSAHGEPEICNIDVVYSENDNVPTKTLESNLERSNLESSYYVEWNVDSYNRIGIDYSGTSSVLPVGTSLKYRNTYKLMSLKNAVIRFFK